VVQATLLSAGFLWNAALLWPARALPGARLGVRVTLVALGLLAGMFAGHAAAFGTASLAGSSLPLAYASYSSLYDLLLEMLLAFGIVVVGLQDAASQITTLAGLLPICAWCRKLRDDQGYWSEFETWAQRHTRAHVTHGICPACKEKHFPEPA
jgi:hypothetical protein